MTDVILSHAHSIVCKFFTENMTINRSESKLGYTEVDKCVCVKFHVCHRQISFK